MSVADGAEIIFHRLAALSAGMATGIHDSWDELDPVKRSELLAAAEVVAHRPYDYEAVGKLVFLLAVELADDIEKKKED